MADGQNLEGQNVDQQFDALASQTSMFDPARIDMDLEQNNRLTPIPSVPQAFQNNTFDIQKNTGGLPPYITPSDVEQNRTNPNIGQDWGEALMAKSSAQVNTLQNKRAYAPMYSFDTSPKGAFKDRYKAYGQDTYNKIGFHPLMDNESWYNDNTTFGDDIMRTMRTAALPMLGLGFMSPIESYGNMLQGNSPFEVSEEEASKYDYLNQLAYSSKGGIGGFTNNLVLSAAYSMGILAEGATEGALIGGTVGLVEGGVGAVPGAAIGGATGFFKNLYRLPQSLYKSVKAMGSLAKSIQSYSNIAKARQLFNQAAGNIGGFINPLDNTLQGFKTGKNLNGLARSARTVGGLWNDIKNINLGLSEGRLEGGFTKQDTYDSLYNEYYERFGVAPSEEIQEAMMKEASAAGWWNSLNNTALVFYSNKIAFPSITRASFLKGLPKMGFGTTVVGRANKDFQLVFKPAEKAAEGVFDIERISFRNALKGFTRPKVWGNTALNYFKANLVEGFQESAQDVLAETTKDYFTQSFYDPSAQNMRYALGTLGDAVGKQISAQGAETFASGFFMGTILQLPGKLANGVNMGYNRFYKHKNNWQEHLNKQEADANAIKESLNTMYKNAKFFYDPRFSNYANQMLVGKTVDNEESTRKDLKDAEFTGFMSAVTTSLSNGTFDMFLKHLTEYKQATPEEIEEAWNLKEGQGQKALNDLDKNIRAARDVQGRYREAKERMGSMVDLNQFKKGSEEYKKAQIFNQAYSIALQNYVFLQSAFENNLQRQTKLFQGLADIDAIKNLNFSEVDSLVDPAKLSREIAMLETELASIKSNPSIEYQAEVAQDIENKQNRINALKRFEDAQNGLLNAWVENKLYKELVSEMMTQDPTLSEESAEIKVLNDLIEGYSNGETNEFVEYKQAFKDLLTSLVSTPKEKANLEAQLNKANGIDELFDSLLDMHIIKNENAGLSQYINLLADPRSFYEHVENNFKWMKDLYNNKESYFDSIIEKNFSDIEKNAILNELADRGIFVDLEEFANWVEDHSVLPEQFVDITSKRVITKESLLYPEYIELFEEAAQADERREAKAQLTDAEMLNNRINELNEERNNEIKNADDRLNQRLIDAYNKSKQQIVEDYNKALEENTQDQGSLEEVQGRIALLENILTQLDSRNYVELEAAYQALKDQGFITDDIFTEAVETAAQVNGEAIRAIVKLVPKIKVDDIQDPEQALQIQQGAAAQSVILKPFVNDAIFELNEQANQITPTFDAINLEDTPEYEEYSQTINEINAKYDTLIEELKGEYRENDRDIDGPDFYTTDTDFADFTPEQQVEITQLFDTFLTEDLGESLDIKSTDPERYKLLRARWLNTQPELIDKFNEEKAEVERLRAEQMAKPPKLRFLPFEATAQTKTEDLGRIYDRLKNILSEGEYAPDSQKPQDKIQLTPQDIANINSDLEAITGYLQSRAQAFQPQNLADKTVRRISETIINRQNEVVEITDEDGNVIGRKFADREDSDPSPTRVTSVAEKVKQDLTGEPQFAYTPIEKDENGEPGPIENLYNTIFQDDRLPTLQAKTDKFIERFRELAYSNYKKSLGSETKLRVIENAIRKNPTFETVEKAVRRQAFKEYSDSGTNVDALTRMFLTPKVTESGFVDFNYNSTVDIKGVPVKISDIMSEEAFNALFAPGSGIVSKIRQGVIDGRWQILSENVLLFDKRLTDNGITGEIDLLAVDTEGNVKIIDIKTGKKGTWSIFGTGKKYDKEVYFRAQQSIYSDLFYNMSGINVSSIGLLPLEMDVTIDGYINSIKRPAMMEDVDGDTVEIEYLPEIVDYGIERIEPGLEEIAEEKVERVTPEEVQIPSSDPTKLTLRDNIGNVVIYRGQVGQLVQLPSGNYAIQTTTDTRAVTTVALEQLRNELALERANEFKSEDVIKSLETQISDLERNLEGEVTKNVTPILFNLEPVADGDINITDIGIQPNAPIENVGQQRVINDQVVNAKFDNKQETVATINGVKYDVLRDASGNITLLSYKQNDNRINNLKAESTRLSEKIFRLRQDQKAADNRKDIDTIIRRITRTQSEKKKIDSQIRDLAADNPTVYLNGSNLNDFIFALNKLPNSFQKITKDRTSSDETRDLKEIGRLSINQTISDAIDAILAENYPDTMDMLIDEGLTAVSGRSGQELIDWAKDSIAKLEQLGFDFINRGDIVDDITRQINVLNLLLSDLELIKLNKDGKISKRQKGEVRDIFDPEKEVQERSGIPTDAESRRTETERVLRPSTERELREIIRKQRSGSIEVLEEVTDEVDPMITTILESDGNNIKENYQKAFLEASKEDSDLSLDAVQEAYKTRIRELELSIEIKDLTPNKTYLMDSFGDIFIVKSKKDNEVTLKDLTTKETRKESQEDLYKGGYMRITDIKEQTGQEVTPEDQEVAKENVADLKKISEDKEAIDEAKKNATDNSREDLLKQLKDNSENC